MKTKEINRVFNGYDNLKNDKVIICKIVATSHKEAMQIAVANGFDDGILALNYSGKTIRCSCIEILNL